MSQFSFRISLSVFAFLAGGVSLLATVAVTRTVAAEEQQPTPVEAPDEQYMRVAERILAETDESSVLVATRKASGEAKPDETPEEAEDDALEPIARISDYTPELAEPEKSDDNASDDNAEQFGAALMRAAQSPGEQPRDKGTTDIGAKYKSLPEAEPARFNGIQPGSSTMDDVIESWGEPAGSMGTAGGEVLSYDAPSFKTVDVLIAAGRVDIIKIELEKSLRPERLAKQLSLDEIRPALIRDEDGVTLGQVFPERGVMFLYHDSGDSLLATHRVSHIVLQSLDPLAFVLRVENRLHGPYNHNIRDLEFALSLNPELAHAHWLLAEIHLASGQANLAESAAAQAIQLEPDNDAYRLRWARTLEMLARYDEAVQETRTVLDHEQTPQVVQAQALHQMGRLAAMGDRDIAAKAMPFHNRAIQIADELATSENTKERRAAKQLLIDAHLAIAREVARGDFDNKLESISQWVSRASGLAEDFIESDGGSIELRLQVAESALAALAEIKPTKDPAPWIKEAEEAAKHLLAENDDLLWQRRIQWQLGVAYFNAVRIDHTRRESAAALRYGQSAIENLASGAKSRQAVPDSEHLVGRLYFHIGAVHAVHERDHENAVRWYDKAAPLLTTAVPVTELAVPRHHGEALVSMGVSYWHVDERSKALELTQAGTELVERAVDGGVLGEDALFVPYGNLATMHKGFGNRGEAAKYAELARVAKPPVEIGVTTSSPRRTSSQQRMASQPSSTSRARMARGGDMTNQRPPQTPAMRANTSRNNPPVPHSNSGRQSQQRFHSGGSVANNNHQQQRSPRPLRISNSSVGRPGTSNAPYRR